MRKTKNQKNQFCMDLPKILLTELFFLFFFVFFGFLRVFGQVGLGEQKTSRKTKKTKKNNFAWTYPRFFSQNWFFCFFCFFWFSSSFWTSGLGRAKIPEKNKKTILHGLTQDSSHRFVLESWEWKKREKTKYAKTQRSQRLFLLNYWSLQDADGSFPAESVPAWASDFLRSFDWDEDRLRCFLDAALGP